MPTRSKDPNSPSSLVPLDRIRSIAASPAPAEKTTVGKPDTRPPRKPVYKQALLILSHGEELPVVIRNLSHTGCRAEYFRKVYPSGRVRLNEPSLSLDTWASVAWNGEGACGLAFEDSEALLERIPALQPEPEAVVDVPAPRVRPVRKTKSRLRKIP